MSTMESESRIIRFGLYEGEIERLEQFPGPVELTIVQAVKLFVAKPDTPVSMLSNAYQRGNLTNLYVKVPRNLADQFDCTWERPERAVAEFLAKWKPPEAEKGQKQ